MSYSYTVPVDPYESVTDRVDAAINDLPDYGAGRDEAVSHRESVLSVLAALAEYVQAGVEPGTERVVSVSGHGTSDGNGARNGSSVTVGVYRHQLANTQEEP